MRSAAFVALFLLAGCLGSSQGEDVPEPTATPVTEPPPLKCLGLACIADPNHSNARYALEHFGLHPITDRGSGSDGVIVEGDWVVWDRGYGDSTSSHDLYAYNVITGDLAAIDQDPSSHAILPIMVEDSVGFYYTKDGQGGPATWNVNDRVIRRVDFGGTGNHKSVGFDGHWFSLNHGYTTNASQDGYWAFNQDDGRRVFLYNPYSRNMLSDGSYETILGADLHNGTAMYFLTGAKNWGTALQTFNTTVRLIDLENGEVREFFKDGLGSTRFNFNGRYVAIEADVAAWTLDIVTGEFQRHSRPGEQCGFPSAGGNFVAWRCRQEQFHYVVLVNMTTGSRIEVGGGNFSLNMIRTDGVSAAILGGPRLEGFTTYTDELYWARISELKPRVV